MAKIVKFCNSCEESFAEKFGFCPNCGEHLQAFEMNPLGISNAVSEPVKPEAVSANGDFKDKISSAESVETAPVTASSFVAAPVVNSIENPFETKSYDTAEINDVQSSVEEEKEAKKDAEKEVEKEAEESDAPFAETKTFAASAGAAANGLSLIHI